MEKNLLRKGYTKLVFNADDLNDTLLDAGIVDEDFDIREYWELTEDDCYKFLDLYGDYTPYCADESREPMWRAALKYLKDAIEEEDILVDVYRWQVKYGNI